MGYQQPHYHAAGARGEAEKRPKQMLFTQVSAVLDLYNAMRI